MSKPDKVVNAPKQKRETTDAQREIGRPGSKAHAWGTVQQLTSGTKKMEARRKVPSGPLGGSGRKTNVSRSS